jgi:hypothetical protein
VTYPVRLKGHPCLTFSTSLAFRAPVLSLSLSQIPNLRLQLLFLWPSLVVTRNELYWAGIRYLPDCAHKHFREVKRDSIYELRCVRLYSGMSDAVFIAAYHRLFSTGDQL